MDEESIIILSLSAFSTLEISAAKELLFTSLSPSPRNVSKRKKKVQNYMEYHHLCNSSYVILRM